MIFENIYNPFNGWSMSEIISLSEQIFDCLMTFAAVYLVGLRDI